ncbi:MAG: HIT domain-containing protein, partial [Gammaproteobacteria bacterium]
MPQPGASTPDIGRIPRLHLCDVRALDDTTGAALMASVARITRAVAAGFPNQGLSLWHSIGEAADQEVPHLHIHVHPRMLDDHLLQIYPSAPPPADKPLRDKYADRLRSY